jgi:hypothetical protein
LCCFISSSIFAETIIFIGGRKIEGEILAFQNSEFEIKTVRGNIKVHKTLIYSIVINSSTDMAGLDTPKLSLGRWIAAAKAGELDTLAACYSEELKQSKLKELKSLDSATIKRMSSSAAKTEFIMDDPIYFGDRATMQVERTLDKDSQVTFLEFVFENGLWKLAQ